MRRVSRNFAAAALACLSYVLPGGKAEAARTSSLLPALTQPAEGRALGGGAALRGLDALGENPAGLFASSGEVLFQHQNLLLNTRSSMAGILTPIRYRGGAVSFHYADLVSEGFDGRDSTGVATGKFSTRDDLLGAAVSAQPFLGSVDSRMRAGIGVKFLRSEIGGATRRATLLDVGLRTIMSGETPMIWSASALDFSPGANRENPPPSRLKVSLTRRAAKPLWLSANGTYFTTEKRSRAGVAVDWRPTNIFVLRGAYAVSLSGAEKSEGLNGLSLGMGFNIFGLHSIDYVFQPSESELRGAGSPGVHLITVTFRLGQYKPPAPKKTPSRSPRKMIS